MASLRPPGTSKHWIGRGRRKDGTQFEFSTEILVEPEGVAPENLPQKRAEDKKRAKEVADDIEARERGSVKEEEFEARMKHRVRKVLQRNSNVPPAVFLVAWTWEHAIRNGLPPKKRTQNLCYSLLSLFDFRSQAGSDNLVSCGAGAGCKRLRCNRRSLAELPGEF